MPVYWLDPSNPVFPPPSHAEPGGLLAVGGLLEPVWLIQAYQHGIFPWFEEDGEFYWYSPDPRSVLFPAELIVHKSMRSVLNNHRFRITVDTDFQAVMLACAEISRYGQRGSWITDAFLEGYTALHRNGIAHSVEVWESDRLVGGLYGLSLGKVFFGESMFAQVSNASKAGFITLVKALEKSGFWLVDCQQDTPHLSSLGARNIDRTEFLAYLMRNQYERTLLGRWEIDANGQIACTPPANTEDPQEEA